MRDADYRWIVAVPLESLEESKDWKCKALMSRAWNRIYLLRRRDTWEENDYFNYAERKQRELGITEP